MEARLGRNARDEELIEFLGTWGTLSFSGRIWEQMQAVACRHGWVPAGTLPPPIALMWGPSYGWDGRYAPVVDQQMGRDDAHNLAAALERAIDDPPGEESASKAVSDRTEDVVFWLSHWEAEDEEWKWRPQEEYRSSTKALLRLFIKHCRDSSPFWLG